MRDHQCDRQQLLQKFSVLFKTKNIVIYFISVHKIAGAKIDSITATQSRCQTVLPNQCSLTFKFPGNLISRTSHCACVTLFDALGVYKSLGGLLYSSLLIACRLDPDVFNCAHNLIDCESIAVKNQAIYHFLKHYFVIFYSWRKELLQHSVFLLNADSMGLNRRFQIQMFERLLFFVQISIHIHENTFTHNFKCSTFKGFLLRLLLTYYQTQLFTYSNYQDDVKQNASS